MGSTQLENDLQEDKNNIADRRDEPVADQYRKPQLLDLSDDVLLYILKQCTPQDLKALGYTCRRLGLLICDYSLWQRVDARSAPTGQERMKWYLNFGLSSATKELKLTGYVDRFTRCLGVKRPLEENGTTENNNSQGPQSNGNGAEKSETSTKDTENPDDKTSLKSLTQLALQKVVGEAKESSASTSNSSASTSNSSASTSNSSASASNQRSGRPDAKSIRRSNSNLIALLMSNSSMSNIENEVECMVLHRHGPQFTFTQKLLWSLSIKCFYLTTLVLEYCNLDYKTTSLGDFPHKLKKLSLRGCWCYNVPEDDCYLHKIQYLLPELESLDVSECDWFDGTALIAISRVPNLRELYIKHCRRLTECVEYASLATRQGFKRLRIVDMRGSPVGDPEVSAFGWLPQLEELYCSPPLKSIFMPNAKHSHKCGDVLEPFSELEPWEKEVPDYYRCHSPTPERMAREAAAQRGNVERNDERPTLHRHNNEYRLYYDILPRPDVEPNLPAPLKRRIDGDRLPSEVVKRLRMRIDDNKKRSKSSNQKVRRRKTSRPNNKEPANGENSNTAKLDAGADQPNTAEEPMDLAEPSQSNTAEYDRQNNTPKIPNTAGGPSNDGSDDQNDEPDHNDQNVQLDQNDQPVQNVQHYQHVQLAQNFQLDQNDQPEQNGQHYQHVQLDQNFHVDQNDLHDQNVQQDQNVQPDQNDQPDHNVQPDQNNRHREQNVNRRDQNDRPNIHRLGRYLRRLYLPALLRGERQPLVQFFFQPHFVYYLVSDMAVLGFGRAKHDLIHQLHMAHNMDGVDLTARPYQSNLRVLSITGYRDITNRSLEHLALSAPYLTRLDFSHTRVTKAGVEAFKALKPECEVIYCDLTND